MERYKKIGLKLTPQRLAILSCLEGNKDHPSAEDIYREVSGRFPTMSFATVYNTLSTLKQRGKVLELTIDFEKKRFDPNTKPHHHLICVRCKKVVDVNDTYELKVSNSDRKGFELLGNHIEFYGICPECKAASSVIGE